LQHLCIIPFSSLHPQAVKGLVQVAVRLHAAEVAAETVESGEAMVGTRRPLGRQGLGGPLQKDEDDEEGGIEEMDEGEDEGEDELEEETEDAEKEGEREEEAGEAADGLADDEDGPGDDAEEDEEEVEDAHQVSGTVL
jgi:hypothetical protein